MHPILLLKTYLGSCDEFLAKSALQVLINSGGLLAPPPPFKRLCSKFTIVSPDKWASHDTAILGKLQTSRALYIDKAKPFGVKDQGIILTWFNSKALINKLHII